ncbi:uroporphyrinogen-III synthase [Pseudomonas sp. 250J]|uniref:Uroporphyrinogen-III synthase n=1 Tax=Pseudomonas peradeniyensis TaxID=2745488 RepID=A0ABT2V4Y9_9PSED|nr:MULTISPECIES: uroporphyrinogen-III synthase [unclassified Pseudomonas]KNX80674.1 uroporphyrinogen-III synthase [Pseudomonas sp. 250J]MCU7236723.1 uroporphyrinogen-III synthase [Pseudomonas peradeniyensis]MCU7278517.1 uroporphyrinogen-III synthase [Pseudomonas peradeniyensis]QZA54634.1 uroporphyrinogen-III synthase [Pseudomonas sp. 2hn]
MSPWRLLLTRPEEDCAALAQTLADAGIASASLPLLVIEAIAPDAAQVQRLRAIVEAQAIIVVSKPAARLLLEQLAQAGVMPPSAGWFTVGEATARILQEHRLQVAFPAAGDDSEALLALPALREAIAGPAPRVLIVRGVGGRELLAERLAEQGASVDYLELYRRCLPHYPATTLAQRIDGERLNGLVVSSGQGLEHLHRLAGADWPRFSRLPLFVPSPRVAEQARALGAKDIVDCRGASAAALLAAVQRTAAPAP